MLTIAAFFAVFIAYIARFFPSELNPDEGIVDTPQNQLRDSYDIIIVGAGISGCVLASRLTENPKLSVLVIEAGGDGNAISDNPLVFREMYNTDLDWNFTSTAQSKICQGGFGLPGGRCPYNRGRVMGGTSSIDTSWYGRGSRSDYDGWEELGNKGWGWQSLLPYFKKLEGYRIPELLNSPIHGTKGPWPVDIPRYITKLREEYLKAGREFGWKIIDTNGEEPYGIGEAQLALDGASATSTSQAYLVPVAKRNNLTVIKRSLVSRILINKNNDRVDGVEYIRNNQKHIIKANREVILAAGPINSPKLLILSGIGPQDELKRLGIAPKRILPVGLNLQDQAVADLVFEINSPDTITTDLWRTKKSILEYTNNGEGPLTTTGLEAVAIFNSIKSGDTPNTGLGIYSWVPLSPLNATENKPLITLRLANLTPKSVGSLTLKSTNVYDQPLINPNFLAVESDCIAFEQGIYWALEFMKTPTMQKYSPKLYTGYYKQCAGQNGKDLLKCLIRYASFAFVRTVGTAKMGPANDQNAVVSSDNLKVRGYKNLRVIDGSVLPTPIRGHSLDATLVVAERASDLVKSEYGGNGPAGYGPSGYGG